MFKEDDYCYFVKSANMQSSWYEARSECLSRNMELPTLSSKHQMKSFLKAVKKLEVQSVYIGATSNSPDIKLAGDYLLKGYEPSKISNMNDYVKSVYGKDIWRWIDGQTAFEIEIKTNGAHKCLIFKTSSNMPDKPFDVREIIQTDSKDKTQNLVNEIGHLNSSTNSTYQTKIHETEKMTFCKSHKNESNTKTMCYYLSAVDCSEALTYSILCQTMDLNFTNASDNMHSTSENIQIAYGNIDETHKFKNKLVLCPKGHFVRDYLYCQDKSDCGLHPYASFAFPYCRTEYSKHAFQMYYCCKDPCYTFYNDRTSIPMTLVCDGNQHCFDDNEVWDEGLYCEYKHCSKEEFKCKSGECIPIHQLCDELSQCRDSSDEQCHQETKSQNSLQSLQLLNVDSFFIPQNVVITFDQKTLQFRQFEPCVEFDTDASQCGLGALFQCPGSFYLPIYLRCNGLPDCPGAEDETHCDTYICPGNYR